MNEALIGRNRIPKHLAVEKAILDAVRAGRFPQGSRLPGDRELAHSLNVNTLTLQPAMRRLCAQGILERRPRVGTFVRKAGCEPNVALLVFNEGPGDAGISRQLLQEMQNEGHARGHQVRPIHLMRPYPPLAQIRDELRAMRAGAVGFLDFLNPDRDFMAKLSALWPCVLLNKGLTGTSLPCVTPDMYESARLIADYFADRGRKTVAAGVFHILHQRHLELSIALEGECLRRGIRVDRRLWQESDSFDFETGHAWIGRLQREPHPPDALVLCSGVSASAVESWMLHAGLTPGRELDVVQFRQKTSALLHPSPWPVLSFDDHAASMTAMRLLFDIVEDKHGTRKPAAIRVPTELLLPAVPENPARGAGGMGSRKNQTVAASRMTSE